MKINYLEDSKENQLSKSEKRVVKFKEPTFYLSERDYEIFKRYEELHNAKYGHTFMINGHILNLLKDRKNIKSLDITPQGQSRYRHLDFTYGEDLYKELMKEANKLKIDINDYIRGIVYNRTMQLLEEKMATDKKIEEWWEDNRTIDFYFCIERDLRIKLGKKYGKRSDDEYKDLVYEIVNDAVTEK